MRLCCIVDCTNKHFCHGYCGKHYHRVLLYGDPSIIKYKRHGKDKKTYNRWHSMVDRCTNPANPSFGNYGGRGIAVCERWLDFEAFLSDMGYAPDGLSLERKDNDIGYSPENCEWATRKTQQRNRRTTRLTIEDARTIRTRVRHGEAQKDIAPDFDISPAYVSQIVNERIWQEDMVIRKGPM